MVVVFKNKFSRRLYILNPNGEEPRFSVSNFCWGLGVGWGAGVGGWGCNNMGIGLLHSVTWLTGFSLGVE